MSTRRSIVIGTAGHIDHGKTVLVKALTGRDTDRLAEEKERGISIDLGFAPIEFSDGSVAGMVDVPGHESFVRNMLAGATGVDLALLVVAADDGVMPQTREHLAILDLLGVRHAVVAVTKADLADEEMLGLVEDEIGEMLEGTALETSPVVPVSGITGQGIDELRSALESRAADVSLKDEALPPRLPIDRVFTLRGIGTVVTGTLWSGSIDNNAQLEVLPGRKPVRVRDLQVHDQARDTVYAGERVALNLAGVPREQLGRGDVITAPGYMRPTYMVDSRVTLLKDSARPLKRGTRLRLHHGTREVLGRIYPFGTDRIEPGRQLPAQLRLESVLVCAPTDRFVLRSYSPVTTIGGGTVVDAHPGKHKVSDPAALREFEELESEDPSRIAAVLLHRAGKPVSAEGLVFSSGFPPGVLDAGMKALESQGLAVPLGGGRSRAYVHVDHYSAAAGEVGAVLCEFHGARPLAGGMAKETLRKRALPGWEPRWSDMLIEGMAARGEVETDGRDVWLPGSSAAVTGDQKGIIDDVVTRIAQSPTAPPTLGELAERLGQDRNTLSELLTIAEKEKRVVRVSPELYFSPAAVREIEGELRRAAGDGITVSDFRNLIGTSRKYALPLLEYFDRMRVTVRTGDVRKLR